MADLDIFVGRDPRIPDRPGNTECPACQIATAIVFGRKQINQAFRKLN
jgi:hypothetical protein